MACFSDLPVELLRKIAGLTSKHAASVLMRVNKFLHNVTLPVLWGSVEGAAIAYILVMLRGQPRALMGRAPIYAAAVRAIKFGPNEWNRLQSGFQPYITNAPALQQEWRTARGYFPNLKVLNVSLDQPNDILTFVSHFLRHIPVTLTDLRVAAPHANHSNPQRYVGDIDILCDCIRRFRGTLRTLRFFTGLRGCIVPWYGFPVMNNLLHFVDGSPSTGHTILDSLSRQPALMAIEVFGLNTPGAQPLSSVLWSQGRPPRAFQALTRLCCSGSLSILTELLELIPSSPIRFFQLGINGPKQILPGMNIAAAENMTCSPEALRKLSTAVARFGDTLDILALVISENNPTRVISPPLQWAVFNPLYACHRLLLFTVKIKTLALVDLTNYDMEAMARSWPVLTFLTLFWSLRHDRPDTSGLVNANALTLQGLESFRRNCGNLRKLHMAWINVRYPPRFGPLPTPAPRTPLMVKIIGGTVTDANSVTQNNSAQVAEALCLLWPEVVLHVGV